MRRIVKGTAATTQEAWKSHALSIEGFTLRNGCHNGPSAVAWCNLRNCIIRDNAAVRSGIAGSVHLENCLIYSNIASNNQQSASAVLFEKTAMINCTFAGNILMNGAGCHAFVDCAITNSVIHGNNYGGGLPFDDGTPVVYSCLDPQTEGDGNIVENPGFIDRVNGDYHLSLDSPCIDAGLASSAKAPVDLDGNPRVKSWSVDMGCYEFQSTPAMPEITPASWTIILGTTNVIISCDTEGAAIYYTTDGSEPTTASTVYRRFRVSGRTTVKAFAVKDGLCSETAVAEYAIGQCADPVITPANGATFDWAGQSVSIAWQGADGVLRYTTDGNDPTMNSPVYGGPFTIDDSTIVKAKAFGDQYFDSAIVTANIIRVWSNVATPVVNAASSFTGTETKVSLSCATEGATIRYTTDGSEPNSHSTRYTGPFYVTDSCTIKAYATCYDYLDSAVATQSIEKVWGVGDTLGVPDHTFMTGGDLPFVRVTDNTAPQGESMKSGAITDSQQSTLSTTVMGSGTISFQWKTSCEDSDGIYDWDHAEFWVDGTRIAQLDGETAWQTVTQAISGSGSHTLLWKYVKDDVSSEGEDCCWVADYHWASALTATQTTEVPVPYVWLRGFFPHTPDEYDAYESAAKEDAANGLNKVWECYVAGLNPTNATDVFRAVISIGADGEPVVGWEPDLNEGGTKHERVYTVEGKENLTDSWAPTNSASRFFRVKVSMP